MNESVTLLLFFPHLHAPDFLSCRLLNPEPEVQPFVPLLILTYDNVTKTLCSITNQAALFMFLHYLFITVGLYGATARLCQYTPGDRRKIHINHTMQMWTRVSIRTSSFIVGFDFGPFSISCSDMMSHKRHIHVRGVKLPYVSDLYSVTLFCLRDFVLQVGILLFCMVGNHEWISWLWRVRVWNL